MPDKSTVSRISFGKFLGFAAIQHVIFALPVFTILVMMQLLPLNAILFLFLPFSGLGIPLSAGLCYLMAKGSNWVNTRGAVMAIGVLPGQTYGVLLGGLLGYHLWAMTGGVIGAIILFVSGSLAGCRVAQHLVDRELAPN